MVRCRWDAGDGVGGGDEDGPQVGARVVVVVPQHMEDVLALVVVPQHMEDALVVGLQHEGRYHLDSPECTSF